MTPPILKRFSIAFSQHKLLGLFIFALILGLSAIVALQPPPPKQKTSYKATGQLSFSNPPPLFTNTGEQLQEQGRLIDVNGLLSLPVQDRIKKQLKLTDEELKEIIEKKFKIILPEPVKGKVTPQIITLEYAGVPNSDRALFVLGTFMKEMVEQSRLLNTAQLRTRIDSLQERLNEVQPELAKAEEQFYRFVSTKGTPLLSVQDGTLFNGITNSEQQQRQLELVLEEIDGQIASVVSQLGLSPSQAFTSAALSADPILASLRLQVTQTDTQIELLQKDLRPDHPRMTALLKQKQSSEKMLQKRATEVLGGDGNFKPLPPNKVRIDSSLDPARQELANNLSILRTQREGLVRQLDSLRKIEQKLRRQYEQFPDRQLQQARLAQEVELKRALYQTILSAMVDARSAEAETIGSYAIAQSPMVEPVVPTTIASMSPLLIMLAGAGLGLVSATGVIFLLATLDDRLHTPKELRDLLADKEVPILGQVPYVYCFDVDGNEKPVLTDIDSFYLAFYERIRSNIRRLSPKSAKVVMLVSVSNDEGKSINAYNLAIASARAGKRTLLLEADLRSSSLAKSLQIEVDNEYNSQPLQYYANRSDAVRLVPGIENLYLAPSPGTFRQVAAILESDELRRFVEDARGRFDLVVIDTPPLAKYNDALLLEPLTDGIITVVRPGITKGSMLSETIEQFAETELPLIGAIINDVEQSISMSNPRQENPPEAELTSV
ncbi:MAG: GumC family protein [Xenococcaceae cyanobacterium]